MKGAAAIDRPKDQGDKAAKIGLVSDKAEEAKYYEMDNTIYGVRAGVVFTLGRSCEWEKMNKGAQLHMADSLEMRATPANFDQVRGYAEENDYEFTGEVKPL